MVKYTEEDTKKLVRMYSEAEDKDEAVLELMELLGKTKNSIISKLSVLKIYESKIEKKTAVPSITKKEIVHNIAVLLDAEPQYLQGLEITRKPDLEYLHARVETELGYWKERALQKGVTEDD